MSDRNVSDGRRQGKKKACCEKNVVWMGERESERERERERDNNGVLSFFKTGSASEIFLATLSWLLLMVKMGSEGVMSISIHQSGMMDALDFINKHLDHY